jgi:hypothetical protein
MEETRGSKNAQDLDSDRQEDSAKFSISLGHPLATVFGTLI